MSELTHYLGQLSRLPVLSYAEVEKLTERKQPWADWISAKLDGRDDLPDYTPAELAASKQAFDRIYEHNLRLVAHVAKRYRSMDYEDLIQEGALGLHRAVVKYENGRGATFSTYAMWWVKQSIHRAVAEKSRLVRVPQGVHLKLTQLNTAERALRAQLGRDPTDDEVMERLRVKFDVNEKLLADLRRWDTLHTSLNQTVRQDDSDVEFGDFVPDERPTPEEEVLEAEEEGAVARALARLSLDERQIMRLYHGLGGEAARTYEECAIKLGLGQREKARQLEARARRNFEALVVQEFNAA